MEKLNEAKETLPLDFITQFVSKGWEEVGILKSDIEAIAKEFKGTKDIEEILQGLVDAYLIAIGQMELHLSDNEYLEIPDEKQLTEKLTLAEEAEKPEERPEEPKEAKEAIEEPKGEKPQQKPLENHKPAIDESKKLDEAVEPASAFAGASDFFVEFDEPTPDSEADQVVKAWLNH